MIFLSFTFRRARILKKNSMPFSCIFSLPQFMNELPHDSLGTFKLAENADNARSARFLRSLVFSFA